MSAPHQQVTSQIISQPQVIRQPAQQQVVRQSEVVRQQAAPVVTRVEPQVVRQPAQQVVRQSAVVRQPVEVRQSAVVRQQPQVVRAPQQGVVRQPATTAVRKQHPAGYAERRLDDVSARILARKVFQKYDANGSGFMNSMETGQMISDLYSSLNVHHPANREEGLEFMLANDADTNGNISLPDFEETFIQHLSTGDDQGFQLFLDANTYATRFNQSGRIRASQGPTTTYRPSPQRAPVVQQQPQVVRQQPQVVRQQPQVVRQQPQVVRQSAVRESTTTRVVQQQPAVQQQQPVVTRVGEQPQVVRQPVQRVVQQQPQVVRQPVQRVVQQAAQ